MKRQFKLRVWNPASQTMTSWDDLIKGALNTLNEDTIVDLIDSYNNNESDLVFQQFTNNLDKNEKEIYDGDLILWDGRVGEIGWEEAHWVIKMRDVFDHAWYLGDKGDKIEIVGNIFTGQTVTLS
jgi:hypothetical protein